MKNNYAKSGFTLIEIMIAVVLLGLAVASLVASNIAFTKANGAGCELSTAEFLIEQMREKTALIAYANLNALDNVTYSPSQNARGENITELSGYSQQIIVENVSNSNFQTVVADGSSNFKRVTVTVSLNAKVINTGSWIRSNY